MSNFRRIRKIIEGKPILEGAGVKLFRTAGYAKGNEYDPFLLLDDFRSDSKEDYILGFPWHPHRGIETITYVTKGSVRHEDSLGNKGRIGSGDIQWMTAGSGIYHQEMPEGDPDEKMYGFQLWANLPAKYKMIEPRYRGFSAEEIPVVNKASGVEIKVIAGSVDSVLGPVRDAVISPEYFDIFIPPHGEYVHETNHHSTLLIYVYEGRGHVISPDDKGDMTNTEITKRSLISFDPGEKIKLQSGDEGLSFLYISGTPINEQIAWAGPIVMNTQEELRLAFDELEQGTFIKKNR